MIHVKCPAPGPRALHRLAVLLLIVQDGGLPETETREMIYQATEDTAGSFPLREAFVDCRGETREFLIDFTRSDDHRSLRAVEMSDAHGRYEFTAMSEADPYLALYRLRGTIRRELATRYLQSNGGRLALSHDELKGRIGYGGLAIDGKFVSFADLVELIQTYEGFNISLQIHDAIGV
ncbi:MAG TPA: hypothetical protein VEX86_09120 [Longimicrobium sp.]|nr:hypothetical protein [Longimicrobium sp.]